MATYVEALVVFVCPQCKKKVTISMDQIHIVSSECEICGQHISADACCPKCNKSVSFRDD